DRAHVLVGDLVHSRPLASSRASLGGHVVRVVGGRAQEQMRGVDAWGVVASVTDIESVRGYTVRKFVDGAMGQERSATRVELPVSIPQHDASPRPALL